MPQSFIISENVYFLKNVFIQALFGFLTNEK